MENSNENLKILFFGDLVGRPGRFAVRDFLKAAKQLGSQAAKSDNSEILQISIRHCEEGVSPTWQSSDLDIEKTGLLRVARNDSLSEISQEQQTDTNPSTFQPFNFSTKYSRQTNLVSGWQSRPTDIKSDNLESGKCHFESDKSITKSCYGGMCQQILTDKDLSPYRPIALSPDNSHTSIPPNLHTSFIIANVENASHGFGLTEKNYNDLSEYGVDCMTSGNHIWDKKEIFNYIDKAEKLIRPFNYPEGTQGQGSRVFELSDGTKIAVINALGRVFMSPVESQWTCVAEEIKRLKEITPIVIVDFHAEATAEKICFAKFCAELGVSAFFGTHTHVQTADEQIMNNMAYITDAGFCGTQESVIGMDYKSSLNRFTTVIPERYDVAVGNVVQINAVEVEIDKTSGHAVAIKRIFLLADKNKKEEENER